MAIFIDEELLKAEYFRQVTVLLGCSRAKNIVTAVNVWGERVSIQQGSSAFAFKGQPMFIDASQTYDCHTVLWDPRTNDKIVIFEQQRCFDPTKTLRRPIVTYKTVDYPPYVSLAHEIGHAWQYLRNPTQYKSLALNGGIDAIERENLDLNEYPVVAHFGLPKRLAYKHTAQHSQAVRQRYQDAGWDVVFWSTFNKNNLANKYQPFTSGAALPPVPTF